MEAQKYYLSKYYFRTAPAESRQLELFYLCYRLQREVIAWIENYISSIW